MGITLLTLLIVAAGVIGYLHFSSHKEEAETPSESQPSIQPDTVSENNTPHVASYAETGEPEFLFFYSGDQIHRLGKDYKWNPLLKKYEEVSLSVTVSANESIGVQNNVTFDTTVTNTDTKIVESQITDAVTQTPKPKKKRGRKPTKKVKK